MAQETVDEKITRLEAELAAVRKALGKTYNAVAIGMAGRNISRANPEFLLKRENQLEQELARCYALKNKCSTSRGLRFRF